MIKFAIKFAVGLVGIFLVSFIAYVYFFEIIPPYLNGPVAEADAICEVVNVGMTEEEINISRLNTLQSLTLNPVEPEMHYVNSDLMQINSIAAGEYQCFCQVNMKDGISTSDGFTFCK